MGGEEFLIILPGCNDKTIINRAERLCECIREEAIVIPGGKITITVSLGVSASGDHKGLEINRFVKIMDDALYKAKDNGRNCVEYIEFQNK